MTSIFYARAKRVQSLKPFAKFVLVVIAKESNDLGETGLLTTRYIAETTCLSVQCVRAHIKELIALGMLEREKSSKTLYKFKVKLAAEDGENV